MSAEKSKPATGIKPSQRLVWSEAAELLGVSRAVAYVYAKNGDLPTLKIGGRLLVPKAALEKLVNSV